MSTSLTTALRAGLFIILLPVLALSQVPRVISYQGVLTDSLGVPKPNGSYSFTFRFYKVPTGGSALWSEAKNLPAEHGLFSTMLGDQTPFPDSVKFDEPYWLSVQIGSDELTPRIRLGAVGYAIRAINADTAKFVLSAGNVQRPIAPGLETNELADNAVTSAKIADGTITSADVAPTFKAPKADTALIALAVANNAVTSSTIADGSITTADVAPTFKAPKADTAIVALVALTSAPSGGAGGDLTGAYPNPSIATGAITEAKLDDNSVTSSKIADGSILTMDVAPTFKAPKADTATFALGAIVADNSIGNSALQDDAVNTAKIADNAVTSGKIADGTILTSDVAASFKAPKADTAFFALAALASAPTGGAGGDLTGSYPNPSLGSGVVDNTKLADNAVNSSKIANGTIATVDVASDFKAPRADTADFALATVLGPNSVLTSAIRDSAVTDAKIVGMSASKLIGALPALNGSVLTNIDASTLQGNAASAFALASHGHNLSSLSGILPIESGGTGSVERNFVSLTEMDTVTGAKIFAPQAGYSGLTVRRSPPPGGIIGEEFIPPSAFSVTDQDGTTSLFKVAWNGTLSGDASGFTYLNASELQFGTIPDGRLAGEYTNAVTFSNVSNLFTGDGSGLFGLNASNLSTGTLPDERLSGEYSGALDLTNPENNYTGRSLNIDDGTLATDKINHRVGVSTTSPLSSMDIQGSLGLKVVEVNGVSGGTTIDAGDAGVFLINSGGGAVTIKLPRASDAKGRVYWFKLVSWDSPSVIQAYGEDFIEGSSTFDFPNEAQLNRVMMVCDGTNWHILFSQN